MQSNALISAGMTSKGAIGKMGKLSGPQKTELLGQAVGDDATSGQIGSFQDQLMAILTNQSNNGENLASLSEGATPLMMLDPTMSALPMSKPTASKLPTDLTQTSSLPLMKSDLADQYFQSAMLADVPAEPLKAEVARNAQDAALANIRPNFFPRKGELGPLASNSKSLDLISAQASLDQAMAEVVPQGAERPAFFVKKAEVQAAGQVPTSTVQLSALKEQSAMMLGEQPGRAQQGREVYGQIRQAEGRASWSLPASLNSNASAPATTLAANPVNATTTTPPMMMGFHEGNQDALAQMRSARPMTMTKAAKLATYDTMGSALPMAATAQGRGVTISRHEVAEKQDLLQALESGPSAHKNSIVPPNSSSGASEMSVAVSSSSTPKSGDAANTQPLIGQVKDYLMQMAAGRERSYNIVVENRELGNIGIQVQKESGNTLSVQMSFDQGDVGEMVRSHRNEIVEHLQRAGLKVNEFTIENSGIKFAQLENSGSSRGGGQENFDSQNSRTLSDQRHSGESGRYGSNSSAQQDDTQRRRELWEFAQLNRAKDRS